MEKADRRARRKDREHQERAAAATIRRLSEENRNLTERTKALEKAVDPEEVKRQSASLRETKQLLFEADLENKRLRAAAGNEPNPQDVLGKILEYVPTDPPWEANVPQEVPTDPAALRADALYHRALAFVQRDTARFAVTRWAQQAPAALTEENRPTVPRRSRRGHGGERARDRHTATGTPLLNTNGIPGSGGVGFPGVRPTLGSSARFSSLTTEA